MYTKLTSHALLDDDTADVVDVEADPVAHDGLVRVQPASGRFGRERPTHLVPAGRLRGLHVHVARVEATRGRRRTHHPHSLTPHVYPSHFMT